MDTLKTQAEHIEGREKDGVVTSVEQLAQDIEKLRAKTEEEDGEGSGQKDR